MRLAFARELRITGTEIPEELQVAARSMAGRNARLLIANDGTRCWLLSWEGDQLYSSYVTQAASVEPRQEPQFNARYWVRRPPERSGHSFRIGGVEVDSILTLPWEELLRRNDSFAVLVRVTNSRQVPISDRGGIVELEIATDNQAVAEQICIWFGGFISERPVSTYAYTHELVYFFRPPLQSAAYFPDGVLVTTPDLLQRLRAEPDLLTRHILICGRAGSGKTNTSKLLLTRLCETNRPRGILILDPHGEYGDVAARHPKWSLQCIAAGREGKQLGRLNINPFLPAPAQNLEAHLDTLSTVFAISAFRGGGTNLPSYMHQLLRLFVADMWRKQTGWPETAPLNRAQRREVLSKTGQEVRAAQFLASPREGPSTLDQLCDFWDQHRQAILTEMTGGQTGGQRSDLEAVITARLNEIEMSLLRHFDYSAQGRSLAALLHTPAVISLEGASEADVGLLVSLLMMGVAEAALVAPRQDCLETVLVIEEAHRVMQRPSPESAEFQSAKQRLTSTFQRAFRELRSRGVGLFVIDQSPYTLIDEAFANTGIKIAHHLQLPEDQDRIKKVFQVDGIDLASFEPGECLVKVEGNPAYRTKMPLWDEAAVK